MSKNALLGDSSDDDDVGGRESETVLAGDDGLENVFSQDVDQYHSQHQLMSSQDVNQYDSQQLSSQDVPHYQPLHQLSQPDLEGSYVLEVVTDGTSSCSPAGLSGDRRSEGAPGLEPEEEAASILASWRLKESSVRKLIGELHFLVTPILHCYICFANSFVPPSRKWSSGGAQSS